MRYHEEVWMASDPRITLPGTLALSELVQSFNDVRTAYVPGRSWSAAVQGPYCGALYAAEEVGLQFVNEIRLSMTKICFYYNVWLCKCAYLPMSWEIFV